MSMDRDVPVALSQTTGADLLQPSKEIVDVIKQLCYDEIGATVDLCFEIFDFFILTQHTPGMAVWIGWMWERVRNRNTHKMTTKIPCHSKGESIRKLWRRS